MENRLNLNLCVLTNINYLKSANLKITEQVKNTIIKKLTVMILDSQNNKHILHNYSQLVFDLTKKKKRTFFRRKLNERTLLQFSSPSESNEDDNKLESEPIKKKMKMNNDIASSSSSSSSVSNHEDENIIKLEPRKKTMKKIKKKKKIEGPNPPPDMPRNMRDFLGHNNNTAKLIMQKTVTRSDIDQNQNRFLMPINKLRSLSDSSKFIQGNEDKLYGGFLTKSELSEVNTRNESNKKIVGLRVTVIDPGFNRINMNFKLWKMNSSENFILSEKEKYYSLALSYFKRKRRHSSLVFQGRQPKPLLCVGQS